MAVPRHQGITYAIRVVHCMGCIGIRNCIEIYQLGDRVQVTVVLHRYLSHRSQSTPSTSPLDPLLLPHRCSLGCSCIISISSSAYLSHTTIDIGIDIDMSAASSLSRALSLHLGFEVGIPLGVEFVSPDALSRMIEYDSMPDASEWSLHHHDLPCVFRSSLPYLFDSLQRGQISRLFPSGWKTDPGHTLLSCIGLLRDSARTSSDPLSNQDRGVSPTSISRSTSNCTRHIEGSNSPLMI